VTRFRRRPIEVEAVRFVEIDEGSPVFAGSRIPKWLARAIMLRSRQKGGLWSNDFAPDKLAVGTLEGPVFASPGDWIICGFAGELYPCRNDIFHKSYEPVAAGEPVEWR
jgi:hypothetical protein